IKDQDRFSTLFGGHEIELEFTRQMLPSFGYTEIDTFLNATPVEPKGLYTSQVRVKDVTTNRIIETYTVYYEPSECNFSRLFSESSLLAVSPSTSSWRANYASWLPDTSNFVSPFNRDKQLRIGRFTTDKLCNAPNQFMDGAFGFSFDFAIQQYGGYFRPFSMKVTNGNANTIISPSQERMADNAARLRADIVNNRWITHNQGPGNYEIEFLPGGQETITTRLTGDTQDRTYTLNYLNVRVRDLTNYKRPLLPTNDSADVNYGLGEIPHQTQSLPARYLVQGTSAQRPVDTVSSNFPLREVMTPSTFNLSAYGWVNGRFDPTSPNAKDGNTVRRNQAMNSNTGTPIGTQGRYYLSAIAGNDTLDFTHMLLIDGCEFTMDYAYKGGRVGGLGGRKYFLAADTSRPKSLPSVDFKAGDKVEIATFGGALGMPRDTARVRFKISPSDVASVGGVSQYTCDMLDQVLIVPNPYVISHIGQRSSYDAKIYFTKLPSECTIKIFTVNGDLIRTVNHVDTDGTSQQGMNFWDLLSDNRQRSVSQGLIAVIETPTCKTIKKFSIVVGGARIIGR
ncbi:MAG: hypothetical protein JNL32_13575, partial [Candidatus Kapabacteria bacterium]|nr:hypothetical protein [Candidatus Kapabacteria bacterium]